MALGYGKTGQEASGWKNQSRMESSPIQSRQTINRQANTQMNTKTKPLQIIAQYRELIRQIPQLLEQTGYSEKYLYTRLDMKSATYYRRKKSGNWTLEELEKLMGIIERKEKG